MTEKLQSRHLSLLQMNRGVRKPGDWPTATDCVTLWYSGTDRGVVLESQTRYLLRQNAIELSDVYSLNEGWLLIFSVFSHADKFLMTLSSLLSCWYQGTIKICNFIQSSSFLRTRLCKVKERFADSWSMSTLRTGDSVQFR